MQVRSLGWEDLLEEGMAAHSSILAWRIPWSEDPGGLQQSMGSQRVGCHRSNFARMHISESFCCLPETNTILFINYSSILKNTETSFHTHKKTQNEKAQYRVAKCIVGLLLSKVPSGTHSVMSDSLYEVPRKHTQGTQTQPQEACSSGMWCICF